MDYNNLSELQIDALREVGNIGAGNAATALSQMIQKKVDMAVPQIDIMSIHDVIKKIGNEEDKVIAIVLRIFGDAPGNVAFILTEESANNILEMLMGTASLEALTEIQMSALQEIGNILTGAYLNSIVRMTNLVMIPSVPAISSDMLSSLIISLFMESEQYEEHIMSIEAKFIEGMKDISGHFFYIPKPGSLEKIIKSLGL